MALRQDRTNGQNYADNIIDAYLDFETVQTWTVSSGTGTAATDSILSFAGDRSLKIENTDPTVDIEVTNSVQLTTIEVGADYQFSFYLRKDDAAIAYNGHVEIFKNASSYNTQTFTLGSDATDLDDPDFNSEWVRFMSDTPLTFAKSDEVTIKIQLDGIAGYVGASTTLNIDGIMLNQNERGNAMPPLYNRPVSATSSVKLLGLFDYNDLATATTPISITGGAGFTYLTNDELGAFTNKLFPPDGITDIWDASSNEFDFSQLPLGSKIEIRLDLTVTTSGANTQIDGALELGIGNTPYDVQWFDRFEKSSGSHPVTVTSFIYIGDNNTQNFPAKFKVEADGNVDVIVNGWACYIHLY